MTVWLGIIAAGAIYATGIARLWRATASGHGVSRRQATLYAAGIVTLVVALASPLDEMADDLFAAHMTQHLLLMSVAAPLLVLGSPVVAVLWALPHAWRRRFGHWWGTRPRTRRALAALGIPAVAWVLHLLAVAFWHIPAAYDWALAHERVHAVEHLTFLLTAALFWWVALP